MSLYLLKILELTPFFYNGGSDPKNVKLNEKVAMGAVLLRHLQNLPCNAHEISELEVQPLTGGGSNGGGKDATSSIVHETGAAWRVKFYRRAKAVYYRNVCQILKT